MTLFTDPAMSLSLCFLTDLPAVSPGMVNKGYTDAPGSLQLGLRLSAPLAPVGVVEKGGPGPLASAPVAAAG
jgi:hypothetical protein